MITRLIVIVSATHVIRNNVGKHQYCHFDYQQIVGAYLYPLPIKMHSSVANSDIKTRRNMMTFREINCVNPLSVGVKTSIYTLNG